ncbi:Ag precursor [Plakobranchus ocellatus]|uniref:Ag n=1 Tax=Plakobranchus ocellatus TaxID=259542 RepID=A0AAV3XRS8_9GAST|nr:Ag precursor [Plakobranchus ocellatus]
MWKLVALLASVLLVTEVSGDCKPLTYCDEIVDPEYMDYLKQDDEKSMVMSYLLGANLDRLCPTVPKYKSCVDHSVSLCGHEDREIYEAKTNLLDYLCSPKGRDLATFLARKTDCGHDVWLQIDFYSELVNCYEIFAADFERTLFDAHTDPCYVVETLSQCLIESAPNACQKDMTMFIEDVWSHATGKKYDYLGCPPLFDM